MANIPPVEEYRSLYTTGEAEQIIQRSRFIGVAAPVHSEKEAQLLLESQQERFPDATHHCSCYITGYRQDVMRFFDDGEPSGTAGMPMLEVLRRNKLTQCAVVVTRYFGGTLLGAGGLVRAYSSSAALAVKAAGIAVWTRTRRIRFSIGYGQIGRVDYFLTQFPCHRESTEFQEDVTISVLVRAEDEPAFIQQLQDQTGGTADMKDTPGSLYWAWDQPQE